MGKRKKRFSELEAESITVLIYTIMVDLCQFRDFHCYALLYPTHDLRRKRGMSHIQNYMAKSILASIKI